MSVVPIVHIDRQVPEHGRIRAGVKGGKQGRMALGTWRLTSPDKRAIEQLAALYGGEAKPWFDQKANPRNQFEVITEATELNVVVVPDSISVAYERYGGKGIERLCDGMTAQVWTYAGRGQMDVDTVDCLCDADGALSCKIKTRLRVFFPDIAFAGVWRYQTSSEVAAKELPGMVELIENMAAKTGMVEAILGLQQHNKARGADFVRPVIRLKASTNDLMLGQASYGFALGDGGVELKQLGAGDEVDVHVDHDTGWIEVTDAHTGEPVSVEPTADDGIVDAELVDGDGPRGFDTMAEAAGWVKEHGGTVRRNPDPPPKFLVEEG